MKLSREQMQAIIYELDAKLKEKDEEIAHLKERLAFPCVDCEELKSKISLLRKAIEPFANLVNVFANAEFIEEAPKNGEIYYRRRDIENAKRAWEETK